MNSNINLSEQIKAIIKQIFPNEKTIDDSIIDTITKFIKGNKILRKADEKS